MIVEGKLILSTLTQSLPILLIGALYFLRRLSLSASSAYVLAQTHYIVSTYVEDISVTISPLILLLTSSHVRKLVACFVRREEFSLSAPDANPNQRPNQRNA